jgi:hypothetical protein
MSEDSKSEKYSTNYATKEGHVLSFFDDEYMQGSIQDAGCILLTYLLFAYFVYFNC